MPKTDFPPSGVALVTGGSGAIGSAVVRRLCELGSRVAFTYRNDADGAESLVRELTDAGGVVEAHRLDTGDASAAATLVEELVARHGGLHTFIYASGPFVEFLYLSKVTPAQFAEQISADAVGFFNVLSPAIAPLRAARGSVVAITTAAVRRAIIRDGLSAGPKGAVQGLVRTLALEEGRFGVRANSIGVGMTSDGMAADLIDTGAFGENGLAEAAANIPLRRFGRAAEVGDAAAYLASSRASFISGQVLNVDGGYTA